MPRLHAVIMAGGSGTRFWPASRALRPKQFLPLANGEPLLTAAVARLRGLCDRQQIWIVTNAAQAAQLPLLLPDFPRGQVIVEPQARDTAPCVALATATIAATEPDAVLAMLPADHVIAPAETFQAMLRRGAQLAADDRTLVTFGVRPTFAATGYGYVECGAALDDAVPRAFACARFCEKPDAPTARGFVESGRFLWNSGIFVWSARAVQAAMHHGEPALGAAYDAMLTALRQASHASVHAPNAEALERAFAAAPRTSIDYAVMEKAPSVAVVEADLQWHDIGSFPAIADITPADANGNHALLGGAAAHITVESRGNVVYAEGARTVALFGVDDLVVVAVDDAVLVCPKDRAADLKKLVDRVRAAGRDDLL